jgi:hypothetical protein
MRDLGYYMTRYFAFCAGQFVLLRYWNVRRSEVPGIWLGREKRRMYTHIIGGKN